MKNGCSKSNTSGIRQNHTDPMAEKGTAKSINGEKNWKHKDILRKEDGKRRERKRAIVALVGSGYEGIEKPVRLKLHVMQRFCDKVTT